MPLYNIIYTYRYIYTLICENGYIIIVNIEMLYNAYYLSYCNKDVYFTYGHDLGIYISAVYIIVFRLYYL